MNSKKKDHLKKRFQDTFEFYIPDSYKNFLTPEDHQNFLDARYDFTFTRKSDFKINIENPDDKFFWLINTTIIEINLPDSKFIVETIVEYLNIKEYKINLVIHPVININRDSRGIISGYQDGINESCIYLEITRLSKSEIAAVKRDLTNNLKELRRIVLDYVNMIGYLNAIDTIDESSIGFKNWLNENFVFLGASGLQNGNLNNKGLGIFRQKHIRKSISAELKRLRKVSQKNKIGFSVFEANLASGINNFRPYYLILWSAPYKEFVFSGHFAHRSELIPRNLIPYIQTELLKFSNSIMVQPESYTYKELLSIAQVIPTGLHFTRNKMIQGWYNLILSQLYADEPEYRVEVDKPYNMIWITAMVPRREMSQVLSSGLRQIIQHEKVQIVHRIDSMINRNQLMIVGLRSDQKNLNELAQRFEDLSKNVFQTWSVTFRRLVNNKYIGRTQINFLLEKFFKGMAPEYQILQSPEETLIDLSLLDEGFDQNYFVSCLKRSQDDVLVIKIYTTVQLILSSTIPVLGHFGLAIEEEYTLSYKTDNQNYLTYSFLFKSDKVNNKKARERLAEGLQEVLNENMISDRINSILVTSGLNARELKLVKALTSYYFQVDKSFSRDSIVSLFLNYSEFGSKLVEYFHSIHDPVNHNSNHEKRIQNELENLCNAMQTNLEEKMARNFLLLIQSIVRSDYYQNNSELSFKINGGLLPFLPFPVPYFEIFVYDSDLEGIHLRGGPVARGGLRWSDRVDDYRTEVLGLMKAQMVKNTVIVPVGSKGGFVIKNKTFANREEFLKAGKATYQRYIKCLLGLTDNRTASGKIQYPKDIRRLDDADPYLVVAADKGTATFSDLANSISQDCNFWLDDAFASGGAFGYDHKVQGITAKGAWQAVRRHFYELGQNPDKDNITVAGIGDMGGDVFGNGMLISKSIKLLAAFNHMYIFLDPDPDPAVSWKERKRLFDNVQNWDQYDSKKISKGGGVYDRYSKKIKISTKIKQTLGLKKNVYSGEELIQAILMAPVDLLWNGGIGTYFKSGDETNFDAFDPSNDKVRINGNQIRARVIGEGGNLGFTQAGRIEAALAKVRLNTDAIDNSAGVDMSDHEVNLKILLAGMLRRNIIKSISERNTWIRKIDKSEIELVLAHNIGNNLGLSLDERRTSKHYLFFRSLITELIQKELVHMVDDHIPNGSDFKHGADSSKLLCRPVLASLMGFSKLMLKLHFEKEKSFQSSYFDRFILDYFPRALVNNFQKEILAHPLRNEIVITEIVNQIVNNAGITFFTRMKMQTGHEYTKIAEVYLYICELLGVEKLRETESIESVSCELIYHYLTRLEDNIFDICCIVIESKFSFNNISSAGLKQWFSLLQIVSNDASFTLPKELRQMIRKLPANDQEEVRSMMRKAESVYDSFVLFHYLNKVGNYKPVVEKFYKIMQNCRLHDFREIVSELQPASEWELRFYSRIQKMSSELILVILRDNTKSGHLNHAMVRQMVDQSESMKTLGGLNMAVLFEMLQSLLTKMDKSHQSA